MFWLYILDRNCKAYMYSKVEGCNKENEILKKFGILMRKKRDYWKGGGAIFSRLKLIWGN